MESDDEDEATAVPEYENDLMVVSRKFGHVFSEKLRKPTREFAGMAKPLETGKVYDLARENGLLTVDSGATSTLTRSLFNMTEVTPKVIKIHLAGEGMAIKSTHVGYKTYYVADVTGTIRPIKTKALYVPELKEDLLGGRALMKSKYRIIMDEDDTVSGIFPVVKGEIDQATRFPFAESEGLFYVETIPISETKYKTMSGYGLWHKRLSHAPIQSIKATIAHSKGLQDLEGIRMEHDLNCTACMVGKAQLQPYPGSKEHAKRPLERVYMDIMTSSITSIEGYDYALIITDDASMYRWAYGLKTKDEANAMVRKWIADITDIRDRHKLEIIFRDNASELKSKDLTDHLESLGFKNYYSAAYEQWQNGLAESSIKSLNLLVRPQMVESGMTGMFWFRALITAKDARNATYHERIKTTPHMLVYGQPKNLSKFRAFGCRAFMTLHKDRRGPGKYATRAFEGINLGFATDSNTSAYVIFVPESRKVYITNQVRFDETSFPFRKQSAVDRYAAEIADGAPDILGEDTTKKWEAYNKDKPSEYYKIVHTNTRTDEIILQVVGKNETYARTTQYEFMMDRLNQQRAYVAEIRVADYSKPPKNFKEALSRPDSQEWIESYRREFQGFKDRDALEVVEWKKGMKVLGSVTRNEYKMVDGKLHKYKTRWCVRGDQQDYEIEDRYAPVLKATEARLLVAIAAQHGADLYGTDTKQALLHGDMAEDEDVYVKPPQWWFYPIRRDTCSDSRRQSMGPSKQPIDGTHPYLCGWKRRVSSGEQ